VIILLKQKRSFLLFAILCISLAACGLLPESTFLLSDASRLPKWFTLDQGTSRSQISVEMTYYVSPFGRTVTFAMKERDGHLISKAKGKVRGDHPIYLGPQPTSDPVRQYPSYEVVTVNGISEVVEHRAMEPIFFVSDDAAVLNQVGLAPLSNRLER
jgi:hypothetical protein